MRLLPLRSSMIFAFASVALLLTCPTLPFAFAQAAVTGTETDATTAVDTGDYNKAISIYTQLITASPKRFSLYQERGLAYYKAEKYDKAIADFTQFVNLRPGLRAGYVNRAYAYKASGQTLDAIVDLVKLDYLNSKADSSSRHDSDIDQILADIPDGSRTFRKLQDENSIQTIPQPGAGKDAPPALTLFKDAIPTTRVKPVITDEMAVTHPEPVRIQFTIASDGSFTCKLLKSSGSPDLDASVLKACAQYRWKPAMRDGKSIKTDQIITFAP